MEAQVEKLEQYFQRVTVIDGGDDGDDLDNEGEYWELLNPDKVEAWSLHMIPHTHNFSFARKYRDQEPYYPISYEERIIAVSPDAASKIRIHCVTAQIELKDDEQYHFTIVVETKKIPFFVSNFIETLEPTEYRVEIPELEKKVDSGFWQNPTTKAQVVGKALCNRLTQLFTDMAVLKGKLQIKASQNAARSVSQEPSSQLEGQGSLGTPGSKQSRGAKSRKSLTTPPTVPKKSNLASSSGVKESEPSSNVLVAKKQSFAAAVLELPPATDPSRLVDYEVSTEAYKNYWATCSDAYVFAIDTKKKLSIDQLIAPPAEMNIRSHEDRLAKDVMNYLWHMPDKTTKQTLCVMPVGCPTKPQPEDWERIRLGEFYIVNGQHSVTASKMMVSENLDKSILKHFLEWDCYIVWSDRSEVLRTISAYYNRVNHFVAMKPSWSTNILGARTVWERFGKPQNPKELTLPGNLSVAKKNADKKKNAAVWKEFLKAMNARFAQLDVVKSQKISRGKDGAQKLKINNELKIIAAPDNVFSLWSEVISSAAHGQLIDPDTQMMFKERTGWKSESGNLTHEFFKWLGNLSYDDLAKLARHILHQFPKEQNKDYPKVTIKVASSVLESCYTAKEWVERRKRKYLVKRELHLLDPTLGLLNGYNELILHKWREFKMKYSITSATMNVLLEQPGDDYWKDAKQTKSRNRTSADMSPYAAEFFKVFLERRKSFQKTLAQAHYRPYNIVDDRHAKWPAGLWREGILNDAQFGVIDFRYAPVVTNKGGCTPMMPYFYAAMTSFQKMGKPKLEDIPSWLFICADMVEQTQVMHYVQSNDVLKTYRTDYSEYLPAKNERMGGYSASNSRATEKVYLIFLQDVSRVRSLVVPKAAYHAPDTDVFNKPRLYNELVYRIHNTELRMEFYLTILKNFCIQGRSVVSVFAGSKFTLAAMMSEKDPYVIGTSDETDTWEAIAELGKSLDKTDFLPKGYFVDERRHPRKLVSSATPSSSRRKSARDPSFTPSSQRSRGSRQSIEVESESEDFDNEDDEDEVENDELTPPPLMSQSVRGSSASSGQAVELPRFVTPTRVTISKKRRRAIDDGHDYDAQIEELRQARLDDRAKQLQMYMEQNMQIDALQKQVLQQRVESREMHDAIMNELRGARPIASLQPTTSNPTLMIQAPTSGSMHSGESTLANPMPMAAPSMRHSRSADVSQIQVPIAPSAKAAVLVPATQVPILLTDSPPTSPPAPPPVATTPSAPTTLAPSSPTGPTPAPPMEEAAPPPPPSDEAPPTPPTPPPDAGEIGASSVVCNLDAMMIAAAAENVTVGGVPLELDLAEELGGRAPADPVFTPPPPVQTNSPRNPPISAPSESEDNLAFSEEIEALREPIVEAVDKVATQAMRLEVVLPSPVVSALKEKEAATVDAEEQGSHPSRDRGGTSKSVGVSLRSRLTEKWLNVVLDLNGLLCVCENAKFNGWAKKLGGQNQPHSATEPAVVGSKLVYVRPNCAEFLRELGKMASITVWSSMRFHTVGQVAEYLFEDQGGPSLVLGQDSCTTLKCRDNAGYITTLKELGTNKELFLKNLSVLFSDYRGKYTTQNTVVVDDSPTKHVMNSSENVVLTEPWTNRGHGPKDTFLLDVLLPWFRRLHLARDEGLKAFRSHSSGKIGRRMLCDERNPREYNRLMDIVKLSSSLK